jgi:hypothetical protein
MREPLLTRKDLAQRYGRSLRTIDQWHADKVLPKPVYIKDARQLPCPFWRPRDILRAEKKVQSLARCLTLKQLEIVFPPHAVQTAAPTKENGSARASTATQAPGS